MGRRGPAKSDGRKYKRRKGGSYINVRHSQGPSAENGDGSFATALKQVHWWLKDRKVISKALNNMTFIEKKKRDGLVGMAKALGYGKRKRRVGGQAYNLAVKRAIERAMKTKRGGSFLGNFSGKVKPRRRPGGIVCVRSPCPGRGKKRRRAVGGSFWSSVGHAFKKGAEFVDPSKPIRRAIKDPKKFFSKPSNYLDLAMVAVPGSYGPGGRILKYGAKLGAREGLKAVGAGRRKRRVVGKGVLDVLPRAFKPFYSGSNWVARNPGKIVSYVDPLSWSGSPVTLGDVLKFSIGSDADRRRRRNGRGRKGPAKTATSTPVRPPTMVAMPTKPTKPPARRATEKSYYRRANAWLRESNFISKTLNDIGYPMYGQLAEAMGYGKQKGGSMKRLLEGRGRKKKKRGGCAPCKRRGARKGGAIYRTLPVVNNRVLKF